MIFLDFSCFYIGSGLMEIISEPQFSNGEEAKAYVKELRRILQCIGTCDGKMSGICILVSLHCTR